jgi:hypothetical protein
MNSGAGSRARGWLHCSIPGAPTEVGLKGDSYERPPPPTHHPQPHRAALEVPRRQDALHVREIDGETVVLDPIHSRMHNLNVTAAFIFNGVDGRRTVEEIWRGLADHFEVPLETAEKDTRSLLEQLRIAGLVT